MNDSPQTFIAYNWGPYEKHRAWLYERTEAAKKAVMPGIRIVVNERFGFASPIFPAGSFPGRLLQLIPR